MDLLNVFYINALEKLYQERKVTESEVKKLQTYLCEKFGSDNFHLVERVRAEDSLEVYLVALNLFLCCVVSQIQC
jgi:hypothetical protein